ncbi:(2Fe-2S)-binding protein [Alteribacillus sp. YIM 98480]|uniref:(2Fe-2S)-binding protein n=1 Tax=Alteribacillus sp. YIM 98480 TaxID=2606599 RepID=UPI00131B9283|nr:(2Fe-2S)-binding protein [Alteribacillus sp. YIM 98480]
MENESFELEFILNGESKNIRVKHYWTLAEVLRSQEGLTGTKLCCEEGECGACTVIVDGKSVTSCIVLAPEVQGSNIVTIEGLSQDGEIDPVQEAFIEEGAVQCGYCIPGMVMSAKNLLDENDSPDEEEIKEALGGNICRCAGYYRIICAVQSAAQKYKEKVKVL